MVRQTSLEKSFSGRDCPNQQVYQLNRAKNALIIIIIIIIIIITIIIVIIVIIISLSLLLLLLLSSSSLPLLLQPAHYYSFKSLNTILPKQYKLSLI